MPRLLRLPFRAGFGLCMTGLLIGLFGVANGYDTPLTSRDVAVVAKHTTRHSDPAKRAYYVAVRAWPGSSDVVELDVATNTYNHLKAPLTAIGTPQQELESMPNAGFVRLIVGQGRFGLEWYKGMELAE